MKNTNVITIQVKCKIMQFADTVGEFTVKDIVNYINSDSKSDVVDYKVINNALRDLSITKNPKLRRVRRGVYSKVSDNIVIKLGNVLDDFIVDAEEQIKSIDLLKASYDEILAFREYGLLLKDFKGKVKDLNQKYSQTSN